MPVHSKSRNCETPKPNAEEFAHFLGDIFASDTGFSSAELKVLLEETSANGLPDVEPFFFSSHLFSRIRSGRSCFTGQLPGMCHLYTGGSGCAGEQGQVQATAL